MRRISLLFVCLGLMRSVASADPPPSTPTTDPAPAPATTTTADPPVEPKVLPAHPVPADPVGPVGPWYTGKYANNRFTHMAITGVLGLYVLSGYFVKSTPTASSCRWCSPPGFDRSARNALVWNNTGRADTLSTIGAYVVAPIVGLTLLIAADKNASATRLIDDVLPVAETVAIVQVATIFGKWLFARERPYAYFRDPATPLDPKVDNFSSFWSGHSVLGFAITAAAGTVCHERRYWTEPYVWTAGVALSLSVEYLRVAADKHYLSDVFVGGLVGLAAGLLVPRLMSRDIKIVPMPNGVAVAGAF